MLQKDAVHVISKMNNDVKRCPLPKCEIFDLLVFRYFLHYKAIMGMGMGMLNIFTGQHFFKTGPKIVLGRF
jgi:hypothetical protein